MREAKVASEPEALVALFDTVEFVVSRIGLDAGWLSQLLHDGLTRAGFGLALPRAMTRSSACLRVAAGRQALLVSSAAVQLTLEIPERRAHAD